MYTVHINPAKLFFGVIWRKVDKQDLYQTTFVCLCITSQSFSVSNLLLNTYFFYFSVFVCLFFSESGVRNRTRALSSVSAFDHLCPQPLMYLINFPLPCSQQNAMDMEGTCLQIWALCSEHSGKTFSFNCFGLTWLTEQNLLKWFLLVILLLCCIIMTHYEFNGIYYRFLKSVVLNALVLTAIDFKNNE